MWSLNGRMMATSGIDAQSKEPKIIFNLLYGTNIICTHLNLIPHFIDYHARSLALLFDASSHCLYIDTYLLKFLHQTAMAILVIASINTLLDDPSFDKTGVVSMSLSTP